MTAGDRQYAGARLAPLSRRRFLGGSVAASVAAVLAAACSPNPSPSPPPATPTPSPTPSPTPALPTSYWEALEELRDAVRGSPDHLVAAADRVVATGDPASITAFVRDRIATYPASFASSGRAM